MKTIRRLAAPLVTLALLANSAPVGLSQNRSAQGLRTTPVKAQAPAPVQDAPGETTADPTIDGLKNPELIQDQVAYRLFLRFLSGRRTEEEKRRGASYVKMVLGACKTCSEEQQAFKALAVGKKDIDALLAAADEYAQKVSVLDDEAKRIRDNAAGRDIQGEVEVLKQMRDALADEVMSSLPGRLGADKADHVRQYLGDVFKRKVKITRIKKPKKAAKAGFTFMRASFNAAAQTDSSSDVANYSDSWFVDNTGSVYHPEDESLDWPEAAGTGNITGSGVTEADYDAEVVSVTTTLRRPSDGVTSSITMYSSPSYTRAETALPTLDPGDPVADEPGREEQWDVTTRHRYRVYTGDPYNNPYAEQPAPYAAGLTGPAGGQLFRKASYGAALPYYWYYYTTYTYFYPLISMFAQAMADPIMVERWYYGRYTVVCQYQRRTCDAGCGYRVIRSGPNWNGGTSCAPYLQSVGLKVRWGPLPAVYAGGCIITAMRGRGIPGFCWR